jgi:hypothetical protein
MPEAGVSSIIYQSCWTLEKEHYRIGAASCIKRLLSDRKHLCEGQSAALERTALVNLVRPGKGATLEGTALVDVRVLVKHKLHVGEKHLVGWWVEKSETWKLMLVFEESLDVEGGCLT